MMVWKMIFLFQGCILRFHVNLPGCMSKFLHTGNVEAPFMSAESSNQITSTTLFGELRYPGRNPPIFVDVYTLLKLDIILLVVWELALRE